MNHSALGNPNCQIVWIAVSIAINISRSNFRPACSLCIGLHCPTARNLVCLSCLYSFSTYPTMVRWYPTQPYVKEHMSPPYMKEPISLSTLVEVGQYIECTICFIRQDIPPQSNSSCSSVRFCLSDWPFRKCGLCCKCSKCVSWAVVYNFVHVPDDEFADLVADS